MQDLFLAFLGDPSAHTYRPLFAYVTDHPSYDPYSDELDSLFQLVAAGDAETALDRLPDCLPNLLLSPRFHLLCTQIGEALGDDHMRQTELAITRACLTGIAASGLGTPDAPYFVTRISDEYDFVHFHLEGEMAAQALIHTPDGRSIDCLTLKDGRQAYFDITLPHAVAARLFADDPDDPVGPDDPVDPGEP